MKIELTTEHFLSIDEDLVLHHGVWLDLNGTQSELPSSESLVPLEDLLMEWFRANVVGLYGTDAAYMNKDECKQAKKMADRMEKLAKMVRHDAEELYKRSK